MVLRCESSEGTNPIAYAWERITGSKLLPASAVLGKHTHTHRHAYILHNAQYILLVCTYTPLTYTMILVHLPHLSFFLLLCPQTLLAGPSTYAMRVRVLPERTAAWPRTAWACRSVSWTWASPLVSTTHTPRQLQTAAQCKAQPPIQQCPLSTILTSCRLHAAIPASPMA